MAKSFRARTTRKIYWALVAGVPRVRQGRVSTYLAKEGDEGDSRMRVARHGDEGASHALTYYAVVDTAAQKLAWLSLKPVTGRTHQLRAHAAHIGHPIVGDPKYFDIENWELPGGIQNKLHLLARRIVIAHPRTGKPIDVTAPLPPTCSRASTCSGSIRAATTPSSRRRKTSSGYLHRLLFLSHFRRASRAASVMLRRPFGRPGSRQGGDRWNTSLLISSVA